MRPLVVMMLLVGCSIDRRGLGSAPTTLVDAALLDDSAIADTTVGPTGDADAVASTDAAGDEISADTKAKPDAKDAGCTAPLGDPCTKIARLSLPQTMDGDDSEFCGVPYVFVDSTNAEYLAPDPASEWVSSNVRARIAWSALGLHMHFAVKDALFAPAPAGTDHFKGDVVEVFAAGHNKLTGVFDGDKKDKGATQIMLTRPELDGSSRAAIWYGSYKGELPKENYKAVVKSYAYDVELFLSWKFLEGGAPASGTKIGLDFAINDRHELSSENDQYMGYRVRKPLPASYCGGFYCDDRVWCQPSLE